MLSLMQRIVNTRHIWCLQRRKRREPRINILQSPVRFRFASVERPKLASEPAKGKRNAFERIQLFALQRQIEPSPSSRRGCTIGSANFDFMAGRRAIAKSTLGTQTSGATCWVAVDANAMRRPKATGAKRARGEGRGTAGKSTKKIRIVNNHYGVKNSKSPRQLIFDFFPVYSSYRVGARARCSIFLTQSIHSSARESAFAAPSRARSQRAHVRSLDNVNR